jgi:hypothetical protein
MAKTRTKNPELSHLDNQVLYDELVARGEAIRHRDGSTTTAYTRSDFDDDMKATILVEAKAAGPRATAQKYGVDMSAISLWRKRERTDPAFKDQVIEKNNQYREDWKSQSAAAIRSLLAYLQRAGEDMPTDDPANVRAIAGALKMVGEFGLAVDITYSKLGKTLDATPALAAPLTEEMEQYVISAADGVVEGDFEDLKEIEE